MSDYNISRPLGKLYSVSQTQIPDRPMVHPETVEAYKSELAAAEARELRLLIEVSNLHSALGYIRACCETAIAFCMIPRSIQARALEEAIAKTKEPTP